ncbi:hypothetical protein Hanom_Chr14g01323751 [Helianthus anomalus]
MTVLVGVIVIRLRRLLMTCPVRLSRRRIKRCRLILIFFRLLMNLNLMTRRPQFAYEFMVILSKLQVLSFMFTAFCRWCPLVEKLTSFVLNVSKSYTFYHLGQTQLKFSVQ